MFAELLRLLGLLDSSAELRHPQTLVAQRLCHPELPDVHEESSTTWRDSGPEEPRRCRCSANLPKFGSGSRAPRHSLGLADTQPLHARLKRSALDVKTGGRAARPAEHPVRLLQSAQQTLPFRDLSVRVSLNGR